MSEAAARAAQKQDLVIELCRALVKGAKWKTVAAMLQQMAEDDAESIRRVIQDYFRKVLLGATSEQDQSHAYLVLAAFTSAFYDSGHAGLAVACYEALGQVD
jgi:HSP90 family molecular chaperone